MKISRASAWGKLMMFGEHAVVYGHPCIVAAIDKTISAEVSFNTEEKDKFILPGVNNDLYLKSALNVFREKYKKLEWFIIKTKADFSDQYGFGSSAAVTVAVLKALHSHYRISIDKQNLFNMAYKSILSVSPDSSGFDVAASVYGGIIKYQKNKKIEQLSYKKLPLIVVYSGKKGDTISMIKKVAQKYKKDKRKVDKIFFEMENIVKKAAMLLADDALKQLGKLMNLNHKLLAQLGVSTKKIDNIIEKAISAGALGAKISGAGGGDCVIVLAGEGKRKKINDAVKEVDGEVVKVRIVY